MLTKSAETMVGLGVRRLLLLLLLGIVPFGLGYLLDWESFGDVERRPPGFSETYTYTDGLEAQIVDIWVGRQLGVPVVEFSVAVRNDSTHTIEAWMTGDLRYGPHRLPALRYLTVPGPDDSGSVQLVAVGESSDPYLLRFVVPPHSRGDLMLELGIDAGAHDPAVFVGGI